MVNMSRLTFVVMVVLIGSGVQALVNGGAAWRNRQAIPRTARKSTSTLRLQLSEQPISQQASTISFSTLAKTTLLSLVAFAQMANARPEGVDRPDLLPKEQNVPLIDVANFLSKGQEKKVISDLANLEKQTGYKLRVLCQSYPNTPGLAIKNYWGVDDNTVVLVVDKGEGFSKKGIPSNIMNLNIGKNADDALPGQFWTRLVNKLGNQPYVKEVGADVAVLNAVQAITYCLADKETLCKDLPFTL